MSRSEALGRATAGLTLVMGIGSALSPRLFLRGLGVNPREVTGAGAFGWRLLAMRNLVVGIRALRGEESSRDLLLPVQVADRRVFAHAYKTRSVPRGGALLAMAGSGAIIVLDLLRRAER